MKINAITWLKNLFSPKEETEIWYGDRHAIRIGVLTLGDKELCFRATAKFVSNRNRVDFVSGIGADRASAIASLHSLVRKNPNLDWK